MKKKRFAVVQNLGQLRPAQVASVLECAASVAAATRHSADAPRLFEIDVLMNRRRVVRLMRILSLVSIFLNPGLLFRHDT